MGSKESYSQMVSAVNDVLREGRDARRRYIDNGEIPPVFDLRDYTDSGLIYGMSKLAVDMRNNPYRQFYGDLFNLGDCLTCEKHVPSYKFFRFKNLCDVFKEVVDECGFKNIKVDTRPYHVTYDVITALSENTKYWRTLVGTEYGCRICIFLYGGRNTDHLSDLANRFRERDVKEAMALARYFDAKMVKACDNILETYGDKFEKAEGKP